MSRSVLVRYGTISEVSRFVSAAGMELTRGERVVIRSHRGLELGTLLEDVAEESKETEPPDLSILRAATDEDVRTAGNLKEQCEGQFSVWRGRIEDWKLQLELVDLEWTLDKSKLILYVLNDRGPECTKLALQAAAAGLGTVEVQPVGPEGPVVQNRDGGCGSGHCGSGGNSNGCCG